MEKEKLYQNKFLNLLLQLDTNRVSYELDEYGRKYTVNNKNDELVVYVEMPEEYEGKLTLDDFQFSKTTHRLLVFLIQKFTNLTKDEQEVGYVEFTVKEFADLCGLKDRDNCKRLIEKDLFSLFCLRCEFNGTEIFIIEDIGVGRGKFAFVIDKSLKTYLTHYKGYVLLPQSYYSASLHKAPEAPGWLYFLVCQSHLNANKSNKNRISVNSLLVRGNFMSIEDIRQTKNNSIKERIMMPLIRNLCELNETFDLKYFNKAGKELSVKQLQKLTYEELIKIVIHYEMY